MDPNNAARIDDDDADESVSVASPVSAADVGSASRSCLVILLLGAAIVVIVCVSLAVRLAF